jgi:hypothetical protein
LGFSGGFSGGGFLALMLLRVWVSWLRGLGAVKGGRERGRMKEKGGGGRVGEAWSRMTGVLALSRRDTHIGCGDMLVCMLRRSKERRNNLPDVRLGKGDAAHDHHEAE